MESMGDFWEGLRRDVMLVASGKMSSVTRGGMLKLATKEGVPVATGASVHIIILNSGSIAQRLREVLEEEEQKACGPGQELKVIDRSPPDPRRN